MSRTASNPGIYVADSSVEPCRRRKIRCILAEGDSRERCVTCIRLKKTCAFLPPERQHSYTGRFENSDNARPIVDTRARRSASLAGQNSRRALESGEQLDSSPTSTSLASSLSTNPWFAPWRSPPTPWACGISGLGNAPTLPFDFQSSLAEGWAPANLFCNNPYEPALLSGNGFPDHLSLVDFRPLPDGYAQFARREAAAYQYSPFDNSAPLPSHTIPLGQMYPPEFQELPRSSPPAAPILLQQSLQLEGLPCQNLQREDSLMESMHAAPEKTEDQSRNASILPLKLDGDPYKRRS